jgi:hypothetical protein
VFPLLWGAAPTMTELVLAGLGEEAADGCSVLHMRLNGARSLDLAVTFMRSASSMTPARD